MPRCAVFTIVSYENYGNRLVSAATCKIFASLGVDAEIMLVKNESETLSFSAELKRKIKKALGYRFDKMIIKTYHVFKRYITNRCRRKLIQPRWERFVAFSAEHIVERDRGLSKTDFPPSFPSEFDFFVVGGDQIWNPFFHFTNIPETVHFLPFIEDGERAFMFSTSFGVSKDSFFAKAAETPGLLEAYRGALSRMRYVTCREDAGVEITNSLAGKGQVLIDPTMTLTPEEWLGIAKEPGFLKSRIDGKKGYALTYFLVELPPPVKKKIKEACANENLALVSLNDFSDAPAYISDPAEFVYLTANAQAVYTDSFHGSVFSILFETPFSVFERLGYGVERIDTLLRKFALEDCLVPSRDMMNFSPGGRVTDFSRARKILSEEREKAIRFLKMAIGEMGSSNAGPRQTTGMSYGDL